MKKLIILFVVAFFAIGCGGDPVAGTPAGANSITPPTSGSSTGSITAVTCPSEPQDCGDECPPPIPSAIASC